MNNFVILEIISSLIKMKTIAVIFAVNGYKEKFPFWYHNSISSFKKWHPDIELKIVEGDVEWSQNLFLDYFINECKEYDKFIHIDCDSITCSKFTEILDDDETPFIISSSSNYLEPHRIKQHMIYCDIRRNLLDVMFCNSSIACINGYNTLLFLKNNMATEEDHALETIGIRMIDSPELCNRIKILGFPYQMSSYVYGGSVLGCTPFDFFCIREDGKLQYACDTPDIITSHLSPFKRLFVHSGMLLNSDGKHIKHWHFSSGKKAYDAIMDLDDHVKKFFIEECNCDLEIPHSLS